jgi:hypothetical protein
MQVAQGCTMSDRGPMAADVLLDGQVSSDEERELVDALSLLGVTAHPKVVAVRRGPEQLQWLILLALPLQTFLSSLGGKIAEDGYRGFKKVVIRILRTKRKGVSNIRPIVLQDNDTGLQIILSPDLPDESYRQLFDLDLSRFRLGPLHYDQHQRRWRSELDEATNS